MRIHEYYVYITTNKSQSTLYTGVTNNLTRRITEHYLNKGTSNSYAGRYHCYNLIYYEVYKYINDAIRREKQIKGYSRQKKLDIIMENNPKLNLLNKEVFDQWPPKQVQIAI